jgi:hypothetical protein
MSQKEAAAWAAFMAEQDTPVPTKWEICETCEGEGHHGPGWTWTASELDEQFGNEAEEFMDDLRRGTYDVPCSARCSGGKYRVPDLGRLTPEQEKDLDEWIQDAYETEAIYRMERMMGA